MECLRRRHIENLAAYELLRRQGQVIVCVDAGMERAWSART